MLSRKSQTERRKAVAEGARQVLEGLPANRQKAIISRIEELITEEMRDWGDHGNDKTPFELRESAYRRGYEQAVATVHELLKKGGFGLACAKVSLFEQVIHNWRYRLGRFDRPRDVLERAPEPGEFEAVGFKTRKNPSFRYGPISAEKRPPAGLAE